MTGEGDDPVATAHGPPTSRPDQLMDSIRHSRPALSYLLWWIAGCFQSSERTGYVRSRMQSTVGLGACGRWLLLGSEAGLDVRVGGRSSALDDPGSDRWTVGLIVWLICMFRRTRANAGAAGRRRHG